MGYQVVVNGAGSELGRAAIAAVSKARGMQLVGAVDSQFDGQDAGQVAGLEELLELPILNDLVMVLGSLSQVLSQNTLQSCLVSLFLAVS
jgi:chloroplast NAD(P)H dehydrogenase